jgi:hypothetical protein
MFTTLEPLALPRHAGAAFVSISKRCLSPLDQRARIKPARPVRAEVLPCGRSAAGATRSQSAVARAVLRARSQILHP